MILHTPWNAHGCQITLVAAVLGTALLTTHLIVGHHSARQNISIDAPHLGCYSLYSLTAVDPMLDRVVTTTLAVLLIISSGVQVRDLRFLPQHFPLP